MSPLKFYKVSHLDMHARWISAENEDAARALFLADTGVEATSVRQIEDHLAINITDEDGGRDERLAAEWASIGPGVIGRLL